MAKQLVSRQVKRKGAGVGLGIDIGGTGIKGALVDVASGKLVEERFRIETPKGAKVKDVGEAVAQVVKHFSWKGKIGCTLPAVVQAGFVRTAANISKKWIGINGAAELAKTIGSPVVLLNDADAAGIAEMRFGAGKNKKGLVLMVTLGTGIGTALFMDGVLVPNSELGHLVLDGKDAEEIASNRVREEQGLEWKDWAKNVDRYLEYIESLMWPDLVIIGGGVSKKAEKFVPHLSIRAKVVPAKLQNDAGIVGAALVGQGI